ncbi:MAG: nicotinate phosphoribosyltransferase [Hyphomicrobiaceae bacterium]
MVEIATRVYNHFWKIDPIVRSLLDNDFYKLLMAQSILRHDKNVRVTFSLINRSDHVPLAKLIDEGALREQLDHIRTLRLSRGESTWLRGNSFYGERRMFDPTYISWLEEFRFPDYELKRCGDQYELTFEGPWLGVMMWEVPALAVVMELRSRAVLRGMGKFALQVLYARAMTRVWEKIEALRKLPDIQISDFGTRRRHSFLWQDWCVQAMLEGLGSGFLGTSNCLIALRREVEAIGTNAHELPMVYAALAGANGDEALVEAPYKVLSDWQEDYHGNLLIILPDTYGTERFLQQAPAWVAKWTGMRIDSGNPGDAGEFAIRWWRERGQDPSDKLLIFSDGLDTQAIKALHNQFHGRVRLGFGWGTFLTNDFRGLVDDGGLDPISLVCKVVSADGHETIKLSDNPLKAVGSVGEVERYKRAFGIGQQEEVAVVV